MPELSEDFTIGGVNSIDDLFPFLDVLIVPDARSMWPFKSIRKEFDEKQSA